uniref:RNA binding protein with serine rich domain 1 n=1 Tax=Anser cygnoides TaxID=8845 RepID=A0A8B9IG76_ANSCY
RCPRRGVRLWGRGSLQGGPGRQRRGCGSAGPGQPALRWGCHTSACYGAPSPTKRKDRSEEKSKDRSKDKASTKESGEKDRGRDKTRKRRSASSGSSSTRSRSSSTSSSGSSSSTGSSSGSSSSSASSRSGSSSTSRSSSSSSSSGSPSPSRRRHDNRRRSRSKSKPPKRDEKERKRRSPSPRPTKVHVGRLTRNVTKDHIMEIFSTYGKIKMIDMPVDRLNPHLSKGYAYVEFENPDDAEKALKHMDGGRCQMLKGGWALFKKNKSL